MIVLDDYIMFDHYHYHPYGVVQAVNEFIVANEDWKVCGFALQRDTFHDIAIRRSAVKQPIARASHGRRPVHLEAITRRTLSPLR